MNHSNVNVNSHSLVEAIIHTNILLSHCTWSKIKLREHKSTFQAELIEEISLGFYKTTRHLISDDIPLLHNFIGW